MKNRNAIAIYNIAAKHLQTAQVCVDRLHELGATHELKLLTGRLQRLALWATPIEEGQHKDETQIAYRQAPEPNGVEFACMARY